MKKILALTLMTAAFNTALFAQDDIPLIEFEEVDYYESESYYLTDDEISEPTNNNHFDLSKFKNGRALSEINSTDQTDAYPSLSVDGLRLYFTQNFEGIDQIVFASRKDINSPFEGVTALNISASGLTSGWLSADELTVYYVAEMSSNKQLFKAVRNTRNEPFGLGTEIVLKGQEDFGFISGASLTADAKQLFLYQSEDGTRILKFTLSGENEYSLEGPMFNDLEGKTVSPGQLSRDGLSYYCPSGGNIYVYNRKSLDDDFEMSSTIEIGSSFSQVGFNNQSIVICHSPHNSWQSNDLYILDNPLQKLSAADEAATAAVLGAESPAVLPTLDIVVFPNPASELVNLRFELPAILEDAVLELLDNQGRVLQNVQVKGNGEQTIQMNVSDLPAGTYFCRLTAKNFDAEVKTLIVK